MRLDKFRQLMVEDNLDGFLITQPHNRRYLSGFTGSAGVLIITPEQQIIATDSRYYEQVRQECPEWELVEAGYDFVGNMLELLRGLGLGARRVGFEAGHISVSTLLSWERALLGRLVLVHTEGFVEELRIQKDAAELVCLKKAVALADEAIDHVYTWIRPGLTELQVAWELESYMRTHGASGVSFDLIVASGPNSAKPHARPTERPIQKDEPITLDLGCIVEDYCSDVTRTFCLGEPAGEKFMNIWNTVLEAQQTAIQGAKAGLSGQAIDKLARDVIEQAGYGKNFEHSLGHGVGLAIHENPRFGMRYTDEILAGSVVTVEPGIYIPGWGGVRIEDMVVVRDDGVEVLTGARQEPMLAING